MTRTFAPFARQSERGWWTSNVDAGGASADGDHRHEEDTMELEMRDPSTHESTYPFPRYYGVPEWLERWEPFRWLVTQRDAAAIPVEEYVEDDEVVIRAELPGIDPDEDVSITIDDDVLQITAQRREERTSAERHRYRSELRYGSFSRRTPLPAGTNADAITATYTDGMLTVRLPVDKERSERTRIPVTRG